MKRHATIKGRGISSKLDLLHPLDGGSSDGISLLKNIVLPNFATKYLELVAILAYMDRGGDVPDYLGCIEWASPVEARTIEP